MEPAGNHGSSIVTPEDVADSEVHRALETSTLCFRRESVNGGLAALFYGTTSTVAVVVNKMILTTYGWNLHWLFFLCQIIFSLVALQTLVRLPHGDGRKGHIRCMPHCRCISAS